MDTFQYLAKMEGEESASEAASEKQSHPLPNCTQSGGNKMSCKRNYASSVVEDGSSPHTTHYQVFVTRCACDASGVFNTIYN